MMAHPAAFLGDVAAERKSGPVRVLDIAAGHGLFGIAVAQRNPQASITALDWEKVLEVAQENAVQAGVADRYKLLPGDAIRIHYGQSYDFILLTNILHHFDQETCITIMSKVAQALNPDGLAITLEFIPNDDRVTPPDAATFGMTMLATTPAGDAYTFAEYQEMWRRAGLERHELIDVPRSPQRLIVSGRG